MIATKSTPEIDSPVEPHGSHWPGRAAFPVISTLFFITQLSLGIALYRNNYWLAVPLALIASHLMHGMLIAFHEASHGLLRTNRMLNEIDGLIIGTLSFMSFSLYRAAHQLHHAYLASERDEELWPFVHPRMPRWVRVAMAMLELTMGIFFTPWLFVRVFLRNGSPIRNKKLRRRIWVEFAAMALVWLAILTTCSLLDAWKYLLWMYFMPGWLAGNMQSLRKYVEHVGLTGTTVNSSTRSVVAEGWHAKFICFTLLHEPYHGVHHWRAGLPHPELPEHAGALEPAVPEERPPFHNYSAALRDLMINLPNPRVGAQWLGVARMTRQELAQRGGK